MRGPLIALGLLLAEGLLALVGAPTAVYAAVILTLVPGLALQSLLPGELGVLGRWLVLPLVGAAAASIVIVSGSTIGIPLTDVGIRLLIGAVVVAGIAAGRIRPPVEDEDVGPPRRLLAVGLGLAAVLCLALALQTPVIGGSPVPGTDWGHYLLYPDEVADHGKLDLDNPYWMGGGEPFRDDPGIASLYGSFLVLSNSDTSLLAHGIWVFALLAIVSVFVFAASLWGPLAGLAAAAIYAVVPMNNTMLGWHGLSNQYGLCLLPLALLAAGWALRGRRDNRWAFLFALVLVALAAAHRLTLLLGLVALVGTAILGLALARRWERRPLLGFAGRTALFMAPLGALLLADLIRRGQGAGGVQSYKVYLVTKVQLDLAISDLTWPVAIAGVLALAYLLTRIPGDRSLFVLYGLAGGIALLSYGWIVHLPTVYYRAVYYAPLLLATALGVALTRLAWPTPVTRRRVAAAGLAAAIAAGLVTSAALVNRDRAPGVRAFYAWASDASLRGLTEVTSRTEPRELVVADRCWAFLAEWLLERPVLAGVDPADILPAWEAAPAATARRILYGPPQEARRLALSRGVRYALVNPGCKSDETGALRLPSIGRPIYESTRLVVLDLTLVRGADDAQPGLRQRPVPLARAPGRATRGD